MKDKTTVETLALNQKYLGEYTGGACITNSNHWSHNGMHLRKPKYWFYYKNFSKMSLNNTLTKMETKSWIKIFIVLLIICVLAIVAVIVQIDAADKQVQQKINAMNPVEHKQATVPIAIIKVPGEADIHIYKVSFEGHFIYVSKQRGYAPSISTF